MDIVTSAAEWASWWEVRVMSRGRRDCAPGSSGSGRSQLLRNCGMRSRKYLVEGPLFLGPGRLYRTVGSLEIVGWKAHQGRLDL